MGKKQRTPLMRAIARDAGLDGEHEKWPSAQGIASLVNYASAPVGAQTYDANWIASNTVGGPRVE